jgi:hypothetical protein
LLTLLWVLLSLALGGCSLSIDQSYFDDIYDLIGGSDDGDAGGAAATDYLLPMPDDMDIYVIQGNFGSFSHRPELGGQHAWDFVDAERDGFDVLAARGGTVRAVQTDSDITCSDLDVRDDGTTLPNCWTFANFVLIDHGDGTSALYLHFAPDTVAVEPGQEVERGQLLGTAGTTGWSTVIHLHYHLEATPCAQSDAAARAQCEADPGWWWTATIPSSFVDEDVLVKHPDGIPTDDPETNPYHSDNAPVP